MKNINVEAEGGEILLQSKEGHYAIIPAKDRGKIKKMIINKCEDCINNYIQTLPKDSDYAEDGTVFSNPPKKVKIQHPDGTVKEYNTTDKEYRQVYNTAKSWYYDKDKDTYGYSNVLDVDVIDAKVDKNKLNNLTPNMDLKEYYDKKNINKSDNIPDINLQIEQKLKANEQIKNYKSNQLQQQLENNKTYLSSDDRTNVQRKIEQNYANEVLNPGVGQQLIEGIQNIPRYGKNPLKLVGDVVSTVAPGSNLDKDLPNTYQDRLKHRQVILNPNKSFSEKMDYSIKEGVDLTKGTLLNVGLAEFGNLTQLAKIPKYSNIFSTGSIANNTVNAVSLVENINTITNKQKLDWDTASDLVANAVGLYVKSDNIDTADALSQWFTPGFKNTFNSWSKKDKVAYMKNLSSDLTAHSLNTLDQIKQHENK